MSNSQRNRVKEFGRDDLSRELKKRIKATSGRRRHLAVSGGRKCGCTSLLKSLGRDLNGRGRKAVWVQGQLSSIEEWAEHFLRACTLAFATGQPGAGADGFRELAGQLPARMKASRRELEELFDRLSGRLDPLEVLSRSLALLGLLQKESRSSIWVICDHFEGLVALTDEAFLAGPFRKALRGNGKVRWLVAASPVGLFERLAGGKGVPLEGLFETFALRKLSFKESLRLLGGSKASGSLPANFRSFLVAFAGGHPFYLEILSKSLADSRRRMGARSKPERLVTDAVAQEVFAAEGRLQLYFQGMLAESFQRWRAPELYQGMLEAVARGQSSLAGISHSIRREAPALSRQVQNLLNSGLVAKDGTRFFIPDPLFRFWVRHVHLAGKSARRFGESGLEQFQDHFRNLLEEYLASMEAETVRNIVRILAASDGKAPLPSASAIGEPEMLPRFDQVEADQKLQDEAFDLIARKGNEYWLLTVFESRPTPARLQRLVDQLERVRQAAVSTEIHIHPVVVALSGLGISFEKATARYQIAVWDRAAINRLAECYGFLSLEG